MKKLFVILLALMICCSPSYAQIWEGEGGHQIEEGETDENCLPYDSIQEGIGISTPPEPPEDRTFKPKLVIDNNLWGPLLGGSGVKSVFVTADNYIFLSPFAGTDNDKLWVLKDGEVVAKYAYPSGFSNTLFISGDDNYLYVSSSGSDKILRYSYSNGVPTYIDYFTMPKSYNVGTYPYNGYLYVANVYGYIYKVDISDGTVTTVVTDTSSISGSGLVAVVVDENTGNIIYLKNGGADGRYRTSNGRIKKVAPDGTLIKEIYPHQNGYGATITTPWFIAKDSRGYIYVVMATPYENSITTWAHGVDIYDTDLNLLLACSQETEPHFYGADNIEKCAPAMISYDKYHDKLWYTNYPDADLYSLVAYPETLTFNGNNSNSLSNLSTLSLPRNNLMIQPVSNESEISSFDDDTASTSTDIGETR